MMKRGRHTAAETSIFDTLVFGSAKLGMTPGGGALAGMCQISGTLSILLAERR